MTLCDGPGTAAFLLALSSAFWPHLPSREAFLPPSGTPGRIFPKRKTTPLKCFLAPEAHPKYRKICGTGSLFFMNRPRTARVLRTLRKKRGKNTENTLGSPLFLPSLRRVARCPRCSRSAPHHGCSASPGARGHEAGMAARQPRLIAILSRRHHGRNIPGQRRRKPNARRALHRLLPGKTGVTGNHGNRD